MLPTQSMNLKKVLKKVMYACMSAAMIAVPTVPAYAAQNDVIYKIIFIVLNKK